MRHSARRVAVRNTTELVNVLHVLTRLVALEPAQADLLGRVCTGPTLDSSALQEN